MLSSPNNTQVMNPAFMFPEDSSFKLIGFDESLKLSDRSQVAHCCIFSRSSTPIFKEYVSTALISMQMRFDGHLGFGGGFVKKGESVIDGLNRELVEEMNLQNQFFATEKDYLFSLVDAKSCFHFYAKEVSREEFEIIEKDTFAAKDYGIETFGMVRVPMFTMRDGYSGFPAFLKNNFAGNAKYQLFNLLIHANLMSPEEITVAIEKSEKGFIT